MSICRSGTKQSLPFFNADVANRSKQSLVHQQRRSELSAPCQFIDGAANGLDDTGELGDHAVARTGEDVTITELAETVKRVVGFDGALKFDASKPDGTPRKLLDVSKINQLGWYPHKNLEDGLTSAYQWFLNHHSVFQ